MSKETRRRIAKFAGLGIGIAIAVVALAAWRVPASDVTTGATVQVTANPSPSLTVSPGDPFLVKTGLRPGGPAASGSVTLTNAADSSLPFRVRALPASTSGLDSKLNVDLSVGNRHVYSGSLEALRQWAPSGFSLAANGKAELTATVSLQSSTATAYKGRAIDFALEFEPAGRNG